MTGSNEGDVQFDVRQSVKGRNIIRLIVAPILSAGLIWFGLWLIPETAVLERNVEAIETWNAWGFLGLICIGSGIYGFLKECIFAIRMYRTTGEWHFRLNNSDLLWHVPNHAHGKEVGFSAPLDELKEIELRTIQKDEGIDEREYWVHFNSRDPVQLKSYSGVSLSWLVEKINAAGVPYKETYERY